uniref:Response regulator n=1 Tax=candidate division WOR-3 bacterium TaxID=2052148 RepID=A0A7C4YRW1_UNCW3
MKGLIVEDEVNIRYLFREFLKIKGIEVDEAEDGNEGFKKICQNKYGFIILDIKMGGKHGIEILEEMRKRGNKTPVIICSAYRHLKDDVFLISKENVYFLPKPVDLNELWDIVQKSMSLN